MRTTLASVRWATGLVCAAILTAGCTQLRVDVSVYKGPIVDEVEGRIAKAVGLTRQIRDIAEETAPYAGKHEGLLKNLQSHYETNGIQQCCKASSAWATDSGIRQELLQALIAYSDETQAVAQRIGVPMMTRPFGATAIALSRRQGDLFSALVTLDEMGRIVDVLANSVLAAEKHKNSPEVFLAQIQYVMASQAPGTLLSLAKEQSWFTRGVIERIFDARYWDNINPIPLRMAGESKAMLVQDLTGNWHLKALTADPTEVLKTAQVVAQTALSFALKASGIPVPTP